MVSDFAAFGFAYQCLAFAAVELSAFLDLHQCGAGTSTATPAEAPLLHSAAGVVPPLAALGVLFVAITLTYRHVMSSGSSHVAAAAVGGARSRLVMFALCVPAGTLEFIVFGQAAGGGGGGGGAGDGALGLAALRALPALATGTFFLGMMLIIVAHVRAGGEGGGTGAVARDGPIQGLLLVLLTKVAAGMAAALVGLMVMVLAFHGAK